MSLRTAIVALQDTLSAKQRELEALRRANERLRARLAAIALLSRALSEVARARRAFGAEGGAVDAEMRRVAALLQRAKAEVVEAAGAAACAVEARGSGGGSGGAADDRASSATCLLDHSSDDRRWPQPPVPQPGASASSGNSDAAAAAATLAAMAAAAGPAAAPPCSDGHALLSQLPHLAEGLSLLHLDDVPPAVVEKFRRMSVADARDSWRALVHKALMAQTAASESGKDLALLAECAGRMYRWKNLLLLLNLPAIMPLSVDRFDHHGTLLAGTAADAPLEHWRAALFDHARLTRAQALLVVELHSLCEEHLAHLLEERADLTRRMATAEGPATAAGAGGSAGPIPADQASPLDEPFMGDHQKRPPTTQQPVGPPLARQRQPRGAAGAPQAAGGPDDALDIAELLEANSGAELATIVLTWIVLPAVHAPSVGQGQLGPGAAAALFISSCWPWPSHEKACCGLLDEALNGSPHLFARDDELAAATAAAAAAASNAAGSASP